VERTFRVKIKGYVQGVGFRYWAYRKAISLGIRGYVRNCPDGSVEVLASGDPENLNMFLNLLERGPSGAFVEGVEIEELPSSPSLDSFRIRYD
jgi:acylphosphatase